MPPSPSTPRPDRAHPRGGTLLRGLSWALALFGAVCLGLTALAIALGARPLIVKTGSMRPELPVGTVVIVRPEPATSARPGQVVAIRRSDGKRIMHRVQSVRAVGGGAVTLIVKGDRNRRADPPLTVSRLERPVVVVPFVGRPIGWVDNPWVQYWLGVLTGAVVLAWFFERRRRGGPAGTPAQEAS